MSPQKQVTPHIRVGDPFAISTQEKYIAEAMRRTGEAGARGHMYGSAAAFCPRANYLYAHLTTISTETTPESVLYMKIGDGIESAIAEGLAAKGKLLFSNLRVPETRPSIGGKIDLVYLDEDEKLVIGEVKSCGRLPTQPKFSHMQQLLTYLAIGGYKRGYLIYISRNVQARGRLAIKIFEADVSEKSMFRILKKICFTQLAIDAKIMPGIPADFSKEGECGYCTFKSECWEEAGEFVGSHVQMSSTQRSEILEQADAWAKELLESRPKRYVLSLRILMHEIGSSSKTQLTALIKELEQYEAL